MQVGCKNILNQLKNNLVNTSAELLIAKGRIDELSREREKVFAQLAEMQATLAAAQSEAKASFAKDDRLAAALKADPGQVLAKMTPLRRCCGECCSPGSNPGPRSCCRR